MASVKKRKDNECSAVKTFYPSQVCCIIKRIMAGTECSDDSLSDDVNGELEALKGIYPADGEFAIEMMTGCQGDDPRSKYICEVTVKPADMMLGLSFCLSASYPETIPRIELVSVPDSMSHDPVAQLLVRLYQVAKEHAGMPLIFMLVESAKEWLQDHQEQLDAASSDIDTVSECASWAESEAQDDMDKTRKNESKKKKGKEMDDDQKFGRQTKKPPMKTATDVISRIQWDKQLNPEHFIVGYLDRFIGIMEQSFTSFYWEDISGVDHRTLAIPRHRIQYFKYKDEVVWDKTQRLDNVFGSLGSGLTVVDVVERYAKENETEGSKDEGKEVDEMEDLEIGGDGDGAHDERIGVEVTEGKAQRKRIDRARPNYFIAIHITSEEIKKNIKQIQDHMLNLDPLVSTYLTSPCHLHITLCTMQLGSEAQINTALSVLKAIQPDLVSMLLPVTLLRFQGIDTFNDRIIYTPPQADPALEKITRFIIQSLSRAGINMAGTRDEIVFHLTIMKMRREDAAGHPIFTSNLQSVFSDQHIGTQAVDTIYLCDMERKPPHDRFYYSLARVDLTE